MSRVASNLANAEVERLDGRYGKRWRGDITAAWLAAAYQSMRQAGPARELVGGVRFADRARPWAPEAALAAGYAKLATSPVADAGFDAGEG